MVKLLGPTGWCHRYEMGTAYAHRLIDVTLEKKTFFSVRVVVPATNARVCTNLLTLHIVALDGRE